LHRKETFRGRGLDPKNIASENLCEKEEDHRRAPKGDLSEQCTKEKREGDRKVNGNMQCVAHKPHMGPPLGGSHEKYAPKGPPSGGLFGAG